MVKDVREKDFDSLLKEGVEAHGHLGPFLVIGMKLALMAEELLCSKIERCEVTIKPVTPIDCAVAGIIAIVGKDKVSRKKGNGVSATFQAANGKSIRLKVKDSVVAKYVEGCRKEYNLYLERIIPLAREVEKVDSKKLFEKISS